MPLDILLVAVSQRGTSSRRRTLRTLAATCDTEGELVGLAAASGRPLLAKIDPYGDLVLTSSEVDQLVAELRSLDGAARGTRDASSTRSSAWPSGAPPMRPRSCT